MKRRSARILLSLGLSTTACTMTPESMGAFEPGDDEVATSGSTPGTAGGVGTTSAGDGEGSESGESTGFLFDVGGGPGPGNTCGIEGESCEGQCLFPAHQACDASTDDPFAAMGIGCPGEPMPEMSTQGSPAAIGVIERFGNTDTFLPREGDHIAVIGTGRIDDLFEAQPDNDNILNPWWCNASLGEQYAPGASLPNPLQPQDVGAQDCHDDPSLVGTGDCSNSIAGQFDQGGEAFDYTEMRMAFDAPPGAKGFSFDFAFLTVEYPRFYQTGYNDMFVGWLESEAWTGNISFDAQGNPISLNASFLEYLDDDKDIPEFEGTCMEGHAGTGWLTTQFPLVEGENDVELVFAIFDLQDAILDSYVLLDNFSWACDGNVGPGTTPVG